jgi:hypothetical protein
MCSGIIKFDNVIFCCAAKGLKNISILVAAIKLDTEMVIMATTILTR